MMRVFWLALALVLVLVPVARAEKLPADMNYLNVTLPPWNATPDDGIDDTAAIHTAISQALGFHQTLYFPCGTYNVSDELAWRRYDIDMKYSARLKFEGQREDCAVIKLADNAAGYTDPNVPKSFIEVGTLNGSDQPGDTNAFNRGFQNDIVDLTIDCGAGNLGVRCVDFSQAHNQGQIRNVTIKSSDPARAGKAGVYMGRNWPGPALLWNVRVEGFDYAMDFGSQIQQNMTFYNVETINQRVAGINVGQIVLSIDGLVSTQTADRVPAIIANSNNSMVTLVNATLTADTTDRSAIEVSSSGKYYVRNVNQEGYASVIKRGTSLVAPAVDEVSAVTEATSHPVRKLFNAPDVGLNLASPAVPAPYWTDPVAHPEDWANVITYGAGNGVGGEINDDSPGFQAAIDSGKAIVYAPRRQVISSGTTLYVFDSPIHVKPTTQRIILGGNLLQARTGKFPELYPCVFVIEGDADDPPVWIDNARRFNGGVVPWICNDSGRKVVVTRLTAMAQVHHGDGQVWALDNIGGIQSFGGTKLYGWQVNSEGGAGGTTIADGADTEVRIVGFKSERDFQQGEARNGGALEFLGGIGFPCVGAGASQPQSVGFRVLSGGRMSVSFTQWCSRGRTDDYWPVSVEQTVDETTRQVLGSSLINTSNGFTRAYIILFVAAPTDLIVTPALTDQTSNSVTYNVVQIDPDGSDGLAMDPGMWTQPADCRAYGRASMRAQKLGDGALDVDFWSCNDIGGPPLGSFDPAQSASLSEPTDCVNLTSKVIVDGIGEAPGTVETAQVSRQLGQIMARVRQCDGDCSALLSLSCSGAADRGTEEAHSFSVRDAMGVLVREVNGALEDGLHVDLMVRVPPDRSAPVTVDEIGRLHITRTTFDSKRESVPTPGGP